MNIKRDGKLNFKCKIIISVFLITILAIIIIGNSKVIFQCGNPIPYLIASTHISEESPYVEVGNNSGIYISKRGECSELFDFIKNSRNVEFVEQIGSAYLFSNGLDNLTISSEIYLKYFTVWKVPQHTLQANWDNI